MSPRAAVKRPVTLHFHPYREDLLDRAAERLLEHTRTSLPDLSGCVVLIGDLLAATALRSRLAERARSFGHDAVLGLRITTLRDWVSSAPSDLPAPLSDAERRLLLVEALRDHSGLFGDDDPWRVADSLLELFDELSRYHAVLPASAEALAERLARGYSIQGPPPPALAREAQIVHRLWRAWQDQTAAMARPDPWAHYLLTLAAQLQPDATEPFYLLVGHQRLIPAERDWVSRRLARQGAEWLVHGRLDAQASRADLVLGDLADLPAEHRHHASAGPDAQGLATCLDNLFSPTGQDLKQRAESLAKQQPDSPLARHLTVLGADSAEQEARAIDLQVRRWLLEGRQRVGIVTEDRRLARRVRALLERAGILLQDTGGWALSTTSAAACVERWLQAVEEDFAHQPLLDFLKSPFLCSDAERADHLANVYRLEHDIIQHENIARDLDRYRRHIEYRRHRLNWPPQIVEPLHALLDRIDTAGRPLIRLQSGTCSGLLYLEQLRVSLTTLGVWAALESDAAGQRVLQLWEELETAARSTPLQMHWREFRIWLGRALEDKTFRPGLAGGPVQLVTLEQSLLLSFDALAVGACDREHLPGGDQATPFFNAGVRRELGLPTWEQRLAARFYQFRHLLESAPQVLLSWRREDQGEPVLPSPWLEALMSLHELAYGRGLEDPVLEALLRTDRGNIVAPQPAEPPPPPQLPRPSIPAELLPDRLSASSHQHLIDCPYLYFAADCLRLSPPEAVRELLQKSDYGERVHRCLEAFHGEVQNLPGPFRQPLNETTRTAAILLMEKIAEAVFRRDLEDNFQHRGWLKRWLKLVPSYVDWQIRRAADWQVHQVEARVDTLLADVGALRGRLDRIDTAADQCAILDYKTGHIPSQEEIDTGEAVQLPIYALLAPAPVTQVEYLQVDGPRVRAAGGLAGAELAALREAVTARLKDTQRAMAGGAALPAWGDPGTCRYCPMEGICRRGAWQE